MRGGETSSFLLTLQLRAKPANVREEVDDPLNSGTQLIFGSLYVSRFRVKLFILFLFVKRISYETMATKLAVTL